MAEPPSVHLVRTDENVAEIDALSALLGGRAGLPALLGDLDRRARRTLAPGRAVHRALTWDAADRRDRDWWPQGITTSADAAPADDDDRVEGRRLLVVSWYAHHDQGCRLTFLDLETRRYRHVLLVVPSYVDGRVEVAPLRAHAGGIVWHGPYLHIAATGRGVHTVRVDDLLHVPEGSPLETFGYRWVLPVRSSYRARTDEGQEKLRYSFLSLDHDTAPKELVVGEYGNRTQTRRLARYPLDPATYTLAADEQRVSRPLVVESEVVRAQGAAVAGGRWYVTASHGPWKPGSLYVGEPGSFRRVAWATPPGPEDITYWPSTDLLWSVSEHPRRRWVYAMERSRFDRR